MSGFSHLTSGLFNIDLAMKNKPKTYEQKYLLNPVTKDVRVGDTIHGYNKFGPVIKITQNTSTWGPAPNSTEIEFKEGYLIYRMPDEIIENPYVNRGGRKSRRNKRKTRRSRKLRKLRRSRRSKRKN
jgi:hypothetical protein